MGRGPEFSRCVFDVYGHSPLVEQFLRMQKLSKDSGTSVLIQRTEIKSLPPYPLKLMSLFALVPVTDPEMLIGGPSHMGTGERGRREDRPFVAQKRARDTPLDPLLL